MSNPADNSPHLGIAGRIAAAFVDSKLTPLVVIASVILGAAAVVLLPREEEPQIKVPMVDVLVSMPGSSANEIEERATRPMEKLLWEVPGVEYLYSTSRDSESLVIVRFKVGEDPERSLVKITEKLRSNFDRIPMGVTPPLIKPKSIDDVPILALTFHSARYDPLTLRRLAAQVEESVKQVPLVAETTLLGVSRRAVRVMLDPVKLASRNLSPAGLVPMLQQANRQFRAGGLTTGNNEVLVETGAFLRTAHEVGDVVIGVFSGRPVYLREVAEIIDGGEEPTQYVFHGSKSADEPAITLSIAKRPGANAISVADEVLQKVDLLKGTIIPADVQVSVTRNYGETAAEKSNELLLHMGIAVFSVAILIWLTLGWRESGIVAVAIPATLALTLLIFYLYGFTLNRITLFALIFSIGILVDDAIVVVENIHRHQQLEPGVGLLQSIPRAVDEVGGPTILATFTVIAALLPMAFVSGLMGPYMAPIPINASMGMLISLAIAFVVTPWLARRWMKPHAGDGAADGHAGLAARLEPRLQRLFGPLLDERRGARNRALLGLAVAGLIALSVLLPVVGWVQLKMLPFDNKSEFQVVVDMPAGTPLEETAAVLRELGAHLATVPEVRDYQAYAGTAAPINFNGLVRQYDLRAASELGDIQVNLVDKAHRKDKSHAIAMRVRPALQEIGKRWRANVKVVEVPPGPPVMAPIVAEVYGPEPAGRRQVTEAVRAVFETTDGVVDVDSTTIAAAPRKLLLVDRRKAALAGVPQQAIVATLRAGLAGDAATYLRDASKVPVPVWLQLPDDSHGSLDALLQLTVRGAAGQAVPIRELVTVSDTQREQPLYHKDLLPVDYVQGDMAGRVDSPLYGMFAMRGAIAQIQAPGGTALKETFVAMPEDALRDYTLRWDGEWRITYETFRDMGAAYAVGLVLIYLLVVAQFGSYLAPLIIMAPIPLTIIGVMPGHALLGAQFTATSMIGMIALAGIIVRNSILLVDFVRLQQAAGVPMAQAVVHAVATRAQPIVLTGVAAMIGAFFILDDPIFNGLAISLIFGILVSTLLTLVVIPTLYYAAYHRRAEKHGQIGT